MTLSGVLHYNGTEETTKTTADITLATETTTSEIYIFPKEKAPKALKYRLAIKEFSFHKKMYQPTEALALISITKAQGVDTAYERIDWDMLDKMFKHAKVSLADGDFTIGDDYYVHEVLPHYKKDGMNVILKIYSPDKMMTVRQASRTWVAKKLFAGILDIERKKYLYPWAAAETEKDTDKDKDTDKEEEDEKAEEICIKCDAQNMKVLRYGDKKTEHIFPFLVQYNESFYDMLARTTNRWGEFLYYEDNKLNIGYDDTVTPVKIEENQVKEIATFDPATKQLSIGDDGRYDYPANNSGLIGKPVQKSPFIVKAQMGAFGGAADKWIINQFSAVFKNDKNLPTLIGNMLFDNLFNLAREESKVAKLNSDFNDKYKFGDNHDNDVQYGNHDFAKKGEDKNEMPAFQQFTELHTQYDDEKYIAIVEKELTVGQKTIHIDYETIHPKLKLGSIISFNDKNFIVVEILGVKGETGNMTFQLVATSQDPADKIFYPSVIPAGHVRYAHPQPATITDADDPALNKNRARVMFSWQTINYEDEEKKTGITANTKELSSPWLSFASNHQGHPNVGKHYEGNPVMVGFEDGNVERPYIMGGLGDEGGRPNQDVVISSPGEHMLTLTDGTGQGIQAFLAGAFSPLFKNFTSFVPNLIPAIKWDKNKYFEGGFELTDRYGMYKISGSTDGRNVSIASNWGDVNINAFTGISISAPNGDVKISGKNVTIEAGNNLKLVSGTNVNYKLWKSKDTKGGTAAQLLLEVTAQVTKKLAATLMDVIDLRVVRSIVEVFFRPVEGSLTLKSNRFLKLEAGENHCEMPENAFNAEKRKKMLDEINKEAIVKGAGIGNGMVEIIKYISPLSRNMIERFIEKYNAGVDELKILKNNINFLRLYADEPSTAAKPAEVCKPIDDLVKDLWKQDKDEDWDENKCGFQQVGVDDGAADKLKDDAAMRISGKTAVQYNPIKAEVKKGIINDRKLLRKDIMRSLNKTRKLIYEATHLKPTKEDINKLVGHFNMTVMPKDFKDKILKAFDPEKLKDVPFYTTIDDTNKKLNSKIEGAIKENDGLVLILRRLVMINLLEEFGFNKDTRIKLNDKNEPSETGSVPENPTVTTVVNSKVWEGYVKSLNGVPKLEKDKWSTIGGALKGAADEALDEQKKKVAFWKDLAEKKTWGEGKNGCILFASGDKTYNMNGDKFEAITPLKSDIKYLSNANTTLDKKEKKTIQGFIEKLQTAMLKL